MPGARGPKQIAAAALLRARKVANLGYGRTGGGFARPGRDSSNRRSALEAKPVANAAAVRGCPSRRTEEGDREASAAEKGRPILAPSSRGR